MIHCDRGIVFVHECRQFVTENEPLFRDFRVPYFRAHCVELPDSFRIGELYFEYYAEFVVKTEVLESDKFEWDDVIRSYNRLCDMSELDFSRDAYLDEPICIEPDGVVYTPNELMQVLHFRI